MAFLLAVVGAPVLANMGVGWLTRSFWIEPECRARCAAIGHGFLVALAKGKTSSAGCKCADGSLVEWSGPSWAVGAGVVCFVVAFLAVLAVVTKSAGKT